MIPGERPNQSVKKLLLQVVCFLLSCFCVAAADEVKRPNILWLVSEDNDIFLGCYGDRQARTPTLDKLAKQGVLYERCFGQPVCAPSRFTLITGMYAVAHGPPVGQVGVALQIEFVVAGSEGATDYLADFSPGRLRAADCHVDGALGHVRLLR